jgi:hypothetical protein
MPPLIDKDQVVSVPNQSAIRKDVSGTELHTALPILIADFGAS